MKEIELILKRISASPSIGIVKKCSWCKKGKTLNFFAKSKTSSDGYKYRCLQCNNESTKKWRKANKEKLAKLDKIYRMKNKDKINNRQQEWRKQNKEKDAAYRKKYYKITRLLRIKNKEKLLATPEKKAEKLRAAINKKIANNIRCGIYKALKGNKNGRHWETIVGYTLKKLKRHLEKQFLSGMTWENYGRNGWHVDHIIPRSVFNYINTEDYDFNRCWSLSNLQPLWEADNIRKQAKLYKHFQPSFIFEGRKPKG